MLSKSEIKYIQSLYQKKFREEECLFIIEGPKILEEALGIGEGCVKKIYGLPPWVELNRQAFGNIEIKEISVLELGRISQLKTPNQVLALAQLPLAVDPLQVSQHSFILALDDIQDPGNMGTIIRIADWFNIQTVVCSNNCVNAYKAKVVQSTMGSIFRVNIYYTHLSSWLSAITNTTIYGAALEGKLLKNIEPANNGVIVIGNESKGISREVMAHITQKITIEKKGKAESLNAAVATGIILSYLK